LKEFFGRGVEVSYTGGKSFVESENYRLCRWSADGDTIIEADKRKFVLPEDLVTEKKSRGKIYRPDFNSIIEAVRADLLRKCD